MQKSIIFSGIGIVLVFLFPSLIPDPVRPQYYSSTTPLPTLYSGSRFIFIIFSFPPLTSSSPKGRAVRQGTPTETTVSDNNTSVSPRRGEREHLSFLTFFRLIPCRTCVHMAERVGAVSQPGWRTSFFFSFQKCRVSEGQYALNGERGM